LSASLSDPGCKTVWLRTVKNLEDKKKFKQNNKKWNRKKENKMDEKYNKGDHKKRGTRYRRRRKQSKLLFLLPPHLYYS